MPKKTYIEYLGGIPGIPSRQEIMAEIGKSKIVIKKQNFFSQWKEIVAIGFDTLIQVEVKREVEVIQGNEKDKSVIGRSIFGGLFLGPTGAVIAGMSGIGKKTVKQGERLNHWLVNVAFQESDVPCIATFRQASGWFSESLARSFADDIMTEWKNFNSRKASSAPVLKDSETPDNSENNKQIAERLKELENLHDSKMISKKEYEKKRKEIINAL